MAFILEHYGFIGGILVLLAFFLNQIKVKKRHEDEKTNILASDKFMYSFLNLIGSIILGIAAYETRTWSALIIEFFWSGFAFFTITNRWLKLEGIPLFGRKISYLYAQSLPILGFSLWLLITQGNEAGNDVLSWYNIVGYLGNVSLLFAYFCNLEGIMKPEDNSYQLFNMAGAAALIIPAFITNNNAIVFIAGAWILITIVTMTIKLIKKTYR